MPTLVSDWNDGAVRWILALCVVSILAGCNRKVRISAADSDSSIRQQVLRYTPKRTFGRDVLDWVADELQYEEPLQAYAPYVDQITDSRGTISGIVRTRDRTIRAIVNTQMSQVIATRITSIEWRFDDDDRLLDVIVERTTNGP